MKIFLVFKIANDPCYLEYNSTWLSYKEAEDFILQTHNKKLFSYKEYVDENISSGEFIYLLDNI